MSDDMKMAAIVIGGISIVFVIIFGSILLERSLKLQCIEATKEKSAIEIMVICK